MTPRIVLLLILILCALSLGAGCAAPSGGGGGAQGGTQPPGTRPPGTQPQTAGSSGEISPGPTVTVPPNYDVTIQENRNHNTIRPYITVTFRGGKGQIFLQKITATVIQSDGQVITKTIDRPEGGQISVGDSMTFPGTTQVDRVIVVVTFLGKDYKILDMPDDFNSHT